MCTNLAIERGPRFVEDLDDLSKTAWWLTYPSEKYEFVSWDYEFPNIWKVIKFMFQTTKQKKHGDFMGYRV